MIVGFEVQPCSVKRTPGKAIENVDCGPDVEPQPPPQEIKEGEAIVYSYDVFWQASGRGRGWGRRLQGRLEAEGARCGCPQLRRSSSPAPECRERLLSWLDLASTPFPPSSPLPAPRRSARRAGRAAGTPTCACRAARSTGARPAASALRPWSPGAQADPGTPDRSPPSAAAARPQHPPAPAPKRFSILNSLLITLVMASLVALILIRTVRRDLAKYEALMAEGDPNELKEESGWKLLTGDVFRAPGRARALCVYFGSGTQVRAGRPGGGVGGWAEWARSGAGSRARCASTPAAARRCGWRRRGVGLGAGAARGAWQGRPRACAAASCRPALQPQAPAPDRPRLATPPTTPPPPLPRSPASPLSPSSSRPSASCRPRAAARC
jgi:hypothetical protein